MTESETIALEPLDGADARALIEALNADISARYPNPEDNFFELDPDEVKPGNGAFVVARAGGVPIGCGAVRKRDAATAEVKRMYVAANARGRGLGRRILDALEVHARALGVTRLVLETGERQPEAIALYERAGFRKIPCFGEYADAPLSVCFEKRLDARAPAEIGDTLATMTTMTLPKQSFLALAAVGWADGSLQKIEATGLVRAAKECGVADADLAEIEGATKKKIAIDAVPLGGMGAWEQVLTYALASWFASLDGIASTDEREVLAHLGDALGLDKALRVRAAAAANDIACLPEGGRPERYDFVKLAARLRERLPQVK